MISGKKGRHLNKEEVDMVSQKPGTRLPLLTINLFLRHNRIHGIAAKGALVQAIAPF